MIPSMAGSFVVRALLPLTWGTENPTFDMVGPAHPTVRSVSTTILRATNAAVTTATQIAGDQADMSQWADAVGLGVSSNLCDALLGLVGEGPDAGKAEVRISWTWAMPAEPIPAVEIPPGIGPILAAGADHLRGEPDEHTVRITGRITNLHRETQQGAGDVTVKGFIEGYEGSNRALRCELDGTTYSSALAAHDAGRTVVVTALVQRAPRGLKVLRTEASA